MERYVDFDRAMFGIIRKIAPYAAEVVVEGALLGFGPLSHVAGDMAREAMADALGTVDGYMERELSRIAREDQKAVGENICAAAKDAASKAQEAAARAELAAQSALTAADNLSGEDRTRAMEAVHEAQQAAALARENAAAATSLLPVGDNLAEALGAASPGTDARSAKQALDEVNGRIDQNARYAEECARQAEAQAMAAQNMLGI